MAANSHSTPEPGHEFNLFPNLPLELQFRIWRECIKQSPPHVFELHDHRPNAASREGVTDAEEVRQVTGDATNFFGTRDPEVTASIEMANVGLRAISAFSRPLLGIDRVSRKGNIRHYQQLGYQLLKFRNAHVFFNADIDTIFIGQDHEEGLRGDLEEGEWFEPFWKSLKHLAFGMNLFQRRVQDHSDLSEEDHTCNGILEELQQFPALETFTLVLDGRTSHTRRTRDHGPITFGDHELITHKTGEPVPKWQGKWMKYLFEDWQDVACRRSHWNVPELRIKSLSRGGKLQTPNWGAFTGYGLPDLLLRERRRRDRLNTEVEDMDDTSGSELDEGASSSVTEDSEEYGSEGDNSDDFDEETVEHVEGESVLEFSRWF